VTEGELDRVRVVLGNVLRDGQRVRGLLKDDEEADAELTRHRTTALIELAAALTALEAAQHALARWRGRRKGPHE